MNSWFRLGTVVVAGVAATACTNLEVDRINYRSASKAPSLEIPPDLSQLSRENRYAIPGVTPGAATPNIAVRQAGDVRLERRGDQQWLVVNQPPEKLWDSIKGFWQSSGFVLLVDQPALGIMETDWAENRAKIPLDFIRRTIGRALDNLYSSAERDKFRTRLERNAEGGTDIFITHRGMQEVYVAGSKDQTGWQPRPSDPELNAEFTKRLMRQLSGAPADATSAVQASTPSSTPTATNVPVTSRAITLGGIAAVEVDDAFDRAWRRVGLSLDRSGFTVEDRDRSQRTYFVRYVEPVSRTEQSFISKMFKSDSSNPPVKLRVALQPAPEASKTHVLVQQSDGTPASASIAQKIVKILVEDLK